MAVLMGVLLQSVTERCCWGLDDSNPLRRPYRLSTASPHERRTPVSFMRLLLTLKVLLMGTSEGSGLALQH